MHVTVKDLVLSYSLSCVYKVYIAGFPSGKEYPQVFVRVSIRS